MNDQVKADFKQKTQWLIKIVSERNFSVILEYCIYACAIFFGYMAFATSLRFAGSMSGRMVITAVLENIQNSSNDCFEFSWLPEAVIVSMLIFWLYSLNKKIADKGIQTGYSLNATIWSWFIPFINFFFPYKILLATKKNLAGLSKTSSADGDKIPSYYSIAWILFWLGNGFLIFSQVARRKNLEYLLIVLGSVLLCIAFINLKKVVKNIESSNNSL